MSKAAVRELTVGVGPGGAPDTCQLHRSSDFQLQGTDSVPWSQLCLLLKADN